VPDDALLRDLALLRGAYREKLPGLLADLAALLPEPGAADEEARWEEAHRLAHRVKGTSGSYGFRRLSGELQRLEDALEQLLRAASPRPEALRAEVEHALDTARDGLMEPE